MPKYIYSDAGFCFADTGHWVYLQAVMVDEDGYVIGAGHGSVGIVTYDDELIVPTAEDAVCGLTMQRILELIPNVRNKALEGVRVWYWK